MAKIIKYQCRPEKKLTNHIILENEWDLPKYVACIECQSCGVVGIAMLDQEMAHDGDL